MASEPIKILAIDDNADNLVTIKALIHEARPAAAVFTALDGASGIALAEREAPDVILLDILMPGMDGFEACRRIKSNPVLSDTPVVFVTAVKEDKKNRIRALESGAEAFLAKPIDESELAVLLNAMIKIRQANLQKRSEKEVLSQLVSEQTRELRQAYQKTVALLEDLKNESRVRQESEARALALVAQLQEADSNKNRFISMLSHELRNPLAAITFSLSVIDQVNADPAKVQKAWDIISRQTAQLTRIVDDLLDVTRINENKIILQCEPIDLTDLIRRITADQQIAYQDKGVELAVRLPERPVHLNADPVRLNQVLENLLHNALKFTRTGDRVTVAAQLQPDGSSVAVRIADTGIGIDRDMLGRLFEPFTQADRSLARSQGGLGLGLAIVKGIVDLHGGVIHAASDGHGAGAEFTIILPAGTHRQPEPASSLPRAQSEARPSSLASMP